MNKALLAIPAIAAVAISAFGALPTSAAEVPLPFDRAAPAIVAVDDQANEQFVSKPSNNFHIIRGGDRKPSFTVLAGDKSQVGHLMRLTDEWNGGTICEAVIQPNLLASCTTETALPLGLVLPEAKITTDIDDATYDSAASTEFHLSLGYENPTMELDSYDPATKVATAHGVAVPGETITLVNGTASTPIRSDEKTGAWSGQITVVDDRDFITARVEMRENIDHPVVSAARVRVPGASVATPVVTTSVDKSMATFHVTGEPGSFALLQDADGKAVIGGTVAPDGTADLTFKAPSHEAHYTVTLTISTSLESDPAVVVINEGIGQATPNAPVIGTVSMVGDRAAVPVSGAAGSIINIRNANGSLVATRMVGTSGSAQVIVPVPTNAPVASFHASTTVDGSTSDASFFAVPVTQ